MAPNPYDMIYALNQRSRPVEPIQITFNEEHFPKLIECILILGHYADPDEIYYRLNHWMHEGLSIEDMLNRAKQLQARITN